MVVKLLRFVVRDFIYNGHLQALGAVGIVLTTSVLLIGEVSVGLLFVSYLVFEIIYLHDRFRDYSVDSKTNSERSLHLKIYLSKIPVFILLLGVVLGVFLSFSTDVFFSLTLLILLMGFLYPIFFKGLTKYIFLFKNVYVSLVHGFLVLYTGVYFSHANGTILNNNFYLLSLAVFVEAMIAQIGLDMKDTIQDKRLGLKTLSATVGQDRAVYYIKLALIPILLTFGILFMESFGVGAFILVLSSFLVSWFGIKMIEGKRKMGYILLASKFFLWLVMILASVLLL